MVPNVRVCTNIMFVVDRIAKIGYEGDRFLVNFAIDPTIVVGRVACVDDLQNRSNQYGGVRRQNSQRVG